MSRPQELKPAVHGLEDSWALLQGFADKRGCQQPEEAMAVKLLPSNRRCFEAAA